MKIQKSRQMKLIIDIPEEDYNNIEPFFNGQTIKGGFNLFKALEIIKNGIPLDDLRAEIEQAADKQFQIAMGVSDLNERYAHIQMENAYRHSLSVIDKYKAERSE